MSRIEPRVSPARAEAVWDIRREAPAVLCAARARAPWLDAELRRWTGRAPAASSCATFQSKEALRPEGHHRSFYLRRPEGAVVGVKGGDVLAGDLAQKLRRLARSPGPLKLSVLESLPISEQKIPMVATLTEALEQARQAARFQAAHLRAFGELARVPVPLLVSRWPAKAARGFARVLLPELSPKAAQAARLLLRQDLGVLLYYYPSVPLRALHLAEVLAGAGAKGFRERAEKARFFGGVFADLPPAPEIAGRWIDLAARMLALGFMPGDVAHRGSGQILQEQNAVLDGGFVDAEPLRPFGELKSDGAFHEALLLAWLDLSATIKRLMVGHLDRADLSWPFADFSPAYLAVPALIACHTGRLLARKLRAHESAGRAIDPRIWTVLGEGDDLAGLDAALGGLFPGRDASR